MIRRIYRAKWLEIGAVGRASIFLSVLVASSHAIDIYVPLMCIIIN